jgi:uncharacterized protein (UPF0548 family)
VRFSVTRPSADALGRIRDESAVAPLTYDAVGATLTAPLPHGWFRDELEDVVGHGDTAFAAAREALRGWRAHAGAGIATSSPPTPIAVGGVVAMALGVGPVWTIGACRIVAVVDERDAFGFAYGTLAGHPERGEESWVLRHGPDGGVTLTVRAISRPGAALVWLGLPVARQLQHRAARGFVRGIRDAVSGATPSAGA